MRAGRNVGEGFVTIVAVEDILPPVSDEKIGEPVVIVVADSNALSPTGPSQPRLGSDVSKRPVAVVPVEVICRRSNARSRPKARAVHQEYIRPAVIVVVHK